MTRQAATLFSQPSAVQGGCISAGRGAGATSEDDEGEAAHDMDQDDDDDVRVKLLNPVKVHLNMSTAQGFVYVYQ